MTRSMTGFARAQVQGEWGQLAWELRSVNHRYLDVSLRLPEEARALEPRFRQQVAARLARGRVECALHLRPARDAAVLEIDEHRLAALAAGCNTVAQVLPQCGAVDPLQALSWPGVVQETVPDADALGAAAQAALDTALADLAGMRSEEGQRLAVALRERTAQIGRLAAQIRKRLPTVRAAWRERLAERLAEVQAEGDPGRLEQEMVFQAQRMDIDEELSRLDSHIDAFHDALALTEPTGRRLDFLMQEFNREANTLSSKSQDAEVTAAAVDMKVLIEQMREQVQNIE